MNGSEMRLSTAERPASEKLPQIAVSGRPDCLRMCLLVLYLLWRFLGQKRVSWGKRRGGVLRGLTRFLNDVAWADFDFGAIGGCPWSGSSSSSPDSSRYLLDHDLNWFAPLSSLIMTSTGLLPCPPLCSASPPSLSPLVRCITVRSPGLSSTFMSAGSLAPYLLLHSSTPPAPPPTSPRPCSAALALPDSRLLPTGCCGSMRLLAMHARCMPYCGWPCEQVRCRWRAGARYAAGHSAGCTPSTLATSTLAICLSTLHSVLYLPAFMPLSPEPYGDGGCPPRAAVACTLYWSAVALLISADRNLGGSVDPRGCQS